MFCCLICHCCNVLYFVVVFVLCLIDFFSLFVCIIYIKVGEKWKKKLYESQTLAATSISKGQAVLNVSAFWQCFWCCFPYVPLFCSVMCLCIFCLFPKCCKGLFICLNLLLFCPFTNVSFSCCVLNPDST